MRSGAGRGAVAVLVENERGVVAGDRAPARLPIALADGNVRTRRDRGSARSADGYRRQTASRPLCARSAVWRRGRQGRGEPGMTAGQNVRRRSAQNAERRSIRLSSATIPRSTLCESEPFGSAPSSSPRFNSGVVRRATGYAISPLYLATRHSPYSTVRVARTDVGL
jgi:hypothetical protein